MLPHHMDYKVGAAFGITKPVNMGLHIGVSLELQSRAKELGGMWDKGGLKSGVAQYEQHDQVQVLFIGKYSSYTKKNP